MHPILSLISKEKRLVLGFMSGTSADGIDCVLTEIAGSGLSTRVRQLAFRSTPFAPEIRREILRIAGGEPCCAADLCRLNFRMGHLYAEAGLALCRETGLDPRQIDLIGTHGQTLWHIPTSEDYLGIRQRSTLQLGEPSMLAEAFGCPVVSDFRVRDVAAGGLGAPLVPYTEYLLYRSEREHIALQNIGGIGNVTIMPAGCALSDVHAFDTGPGNMIMDAVTARLTQGAMTYDEGGRLAAGGRVDRSLLAWLLDDPYYAQLPPKTTGREKYGPAYLQQLLSRAGALSLTDVLATVTRFTAETIALGIRRFARVQPDKLIVGGGGSLNHTLMEHLRALLPHCRVMTNEDLGLDSSAKEAVAFAILANEAVFASPNNAPGATGAAHPVVMGKISL